MSIRERSSPNVHTPRLGGRAIQAVPGLIRFGTDTSIGVPGASTSGTNRLAKTRGPVDPEHASATTRSTARCRALSPASVGWAIAHAVGPDAEVWSVVCRMDGGHASSIPPPERRKPRYLQGFLRYGSDGTRTRDLRRDRPAL
jgi:hypothetical protein